MIRNIVIGSPIIDSWKLIAEDEQDWENFEKRDTLFTETRFLPAVLKEAGIVSSTSEVKRNKPELFIALNNLDCMWIKWGKKIVYIIVGE